MNKHEIIEGLVKAKYDAFKSKKRSMKNGDYQRANDSVNIMKGIDVSALALGISVVEFESVWNHHIIVERKVDAIKRNWHRRKSNG